MSIKPKSTHLIKLYYGLILAALISQASLTVFKLSQTVRYQDRITQLQQQKQELLAEQRKIEAKLGVTSSLALNQASLKDNYETIDQPIHLTSTQIVALR